MFIINKPKYHISVLNIQQLESHIKEIESTYKIKYPNSVIRTEIEPDPHSIVFDGSNINFTYRVSIEFS